MQDGVQIETQRRRHSDFMPLKACKTTVNAFGHRTCLCWEQADPSAPAR